MTSRFRINLGLALTSLMLLAVLSTALIVHYSWMRVSSANIESIVGSLNASTAKSVQRELEGTFKSSEAAVEIIRSILFQGAIKSEDEAKREFVFLSVLRSQLAVSWLGFAFPDGRFFGAHTAADGKIEMVEIGQLVDESMRYFRRDTYRPIPGDIFFETREKSTTAYVTLGAKWYRAAKDSEQSVWSIVDILPTGFEPAAVVSAPLRNNARYDGVIMASINFDRLSQFLATLNIASFGAAHIVNEAGTAIATSGGQDFDEIFRLSAAAKAESALINDGTGRAHYVTMTPLGFNGWKLMTAIPRDAFTAEIDRSTRRLVILVIALAVLTAISSAVFANFSFARPIRRIVAELRHIESFSLADVKRIPSWLSELDDLSGALKRMATSLSAFSKFVPTEIVRSLIAQGIEPVPGGETREITVIFADLPGFTTLTERYGPEVTPFLTEFLTLATDAIHREGGTVDKFIGDCIMGVWNAPTPLEDHALHAVRAAQAIRSLMQKVSRPDGAVTGSRVRIGISTGRVFVGNIGSSQRLSYTAIGDAVNVASRLEGLGKEYGVEIIISEHTREALGGRVTLRELGESGIRGRSGVIKVYEVPGDSEQISIR